MEWKGAHLRYGQSERWDGTSWEPSASRCTQATVLQVQCMTMVSSVMPGFLLLLSLPVLLSTTINSSPPATCWTGLQSWPVQEPGSWATPAPQ